MSIIRVKVRRVHGNERVVSAQRMFAQAAIFLHNEIEASRTDASKGYPFEKPFDAVVSDILHWTNITVEGKR